MIDTREDLVFSDPATFVVIKNSLYAAAEEITRTSLAPFDRGTEGENPFKLQQQLQELLQQKQVECQQ